MKDINLADDLPQRKSLRLQGYDYSQNGAYFITICSYNREYLFGEIIDEKMILSQMGIIIREEWIKSADIREEIELDEFVIMPNHFHGIVFIDSRGDRPVARGSDKKNLLGPKSKSISSLIAGFKGAVTIRINAMYKSPGTPIWQRNYYEHIIRSEESLDKIREYVVNNPCNWQDDKLNKINM